MRKLKDGGEPGKQIGKISFIDLAGSERGAGHDELGTCGTSLSKAVCLAHLYTVYQFDSFDNHATQHH